MVRRKTKSKDLEAVMSEILAEYAEDVTEATNKAVKAVADSAKKEIQKNAPVRTGAYKKGWAVRQSRTGRFGNTAIVYNRSHYQLTHLLEKGHALRGGGRTRPIIHIKPAYDHAVENIRKAVERIAEER